MTTETPTFPLLTPYNLGKFDLSHRSIKSGVIPIFLIQFGLPVNGLELGIEMKTKGGRLRGRETLLQVVFGFKGGRNVKWKCGRWKLREGGREGQNDAFGFFFITSARAYTRRLNVEFFLKKIEKFYI